MQCIAIRHRCNSDATKCRRAGKTLVDIVYSIDAAAASHTHTYTHKKRLRSPRIGENVWSYPNTTHRRPALFGLQTIAALRRICRNTTATTRPPQRQTVENVCAQTRDFPAADDDVDEPMSILSPHACRRLAIGWHRIPSHFNAYRSISACIAEYTCAARTRREYVGMCLWSDAGWSVRLAPVRRA